MSTAAGDPICPRCGSMVPHACGFGSMSLPMWPVYAEALARDATIERLTKELQEAKRIRPMLEGAPVLWMKGERFMYTQIGDDPGDEWVRVGVWA